MKFVSHTIFGSALLFFRSVQASCEVPVVSHCHADGCCGVGVTHIEEGNACVVSCESGFESVFMAQCKHGHLQVSCIEESLVRRLSSHGPSAGPSSGPVTTAAPATVAATVAATMAPATVAATVAPATAAPATVAATMGDTSSNTSVTTLAPVVAVMTTLAPMNQSNMTTMMPVPEPMATVSFNVSVSMSAEDAISNFNLTAYQMSLAATYEPDAQVTVVAVFKMKVEYSFAGAVTEAAVKPQIATVNSVSESQVSVVITAVPASRRLESLRRLDSHGSSSATSTVAAEIATENQNQLEALQTTMEQPLIVGGVTAVASNATVDVELVTTVVQSTIAAPPSAAAVGGFFPNVEVVVEVSEAYGVVWTNMACSDSSMSCNAGRQKRENAASLGCSDAECGPTDEDTCCESTGLAGGNSNAETLSKPLASIFVVFVSSFFLL